MVQKAANSNYNHIWPLQTSTQPLIESTKHAFKSLQNEQVVYQLNTAIHTCIKETG